MSKIQTFNHYIFGGLPVIVLEGIEWFGASEAATALSFSNPRAAISNHVEDEDVMVHDTLTNSGTQKKKFINESGLYSLIFGAAKQGNNKEIKHKATQFKKWVTSEVLPSIRKHGMYAKDELLDNPDLLLDVVLKLKQERENRLLLEQQAKLNQPKVLFADAVSASKTTILIGDLAKLLKQNGYNTGQKRLFQELREKGYLIKRKGSDYNSPTQRAMEMGLFEVKETAITHSDGQITISKTTKVTGKGQQYFINKFIRKTNLLRELTGG